MDKKRVIAVTGATGAQGGGLIRAILGDRSGSFAVRAITRDANGDKAKALAALGAEVVEANLDRVESLNKAFLGVHGAYCVTNFWEHMSPEKELEQASNLAEAAEYAGLEHVIWSTLEDTRKWVPLKDDRMPTLMGRYKVPHFDVKGEANRYFSDTGVPTTFLLTSFYWDNLITAGLGPKPGPDGQLQISWPMDDKKLPGIAANDIGACAFSIFKQGKHYYDKTVGIAGGHLTGNEMAAALTQALGRPVRYQTISPEAFRGLGFPGAEDLANMFQFKRDFEAQFCAARSLEVSRKLYPAIQTFEAWLANNKDRIPLA